MTVACRINMSALPSASAVQGLSANAASTAASSVLMWVSVSAEFRGGCPEAEDLPATLPPPNAVHHPQFKPFQPQAEALRPPRSMLSLPRRFSSVHNCRILQRGACSMKRPKKISVLKENRERRMRSMIEIRSIDYVPEAERHGGLLSQFTLWLGANLQITAIITGALAVVLGGDVFWSLVGLLLGQLLGGAVMALHGAQGPQLGLPQMISSRVQFGVYGAIIPIFAVCLMYIGFSASGSVLAGQAIAQLLHVDEGVGILIFGGIIVIVAMFGYRMIHVMGRLASLVGGVAFVYMFSRLLLTYDVGALLAARHFSFNQFLLAMSLSASWQIAYGP